MCRVYRSQDMKFLIVGVGDELGVMVTEGVAEDELLVGVVRSVPVTETKLSRMRAWAEVVSSPKKRKFGVW